MPDDSAAFGDAIAAAVSDAIENACPFCNAHAHYDGTRDDALAVARAHHLVIATGEHAYRDSSAFADANTDY